METASIKLSLPFINNKNYSKNNHLNSNYTSSPTRNISKILNSFSENTAIEKITYNLNQSSHIIHSTQLKSKIIPVSEKMSETIGKPPLDLSYKQNNENFQPKKNSDAHSTSNAIDIVSREKDDRDRIRERDDRSRIYDNRRRGNDHSIDLPNGMDDFDRRPGSSDRFGRSRNPYLDSGRERNFYDRGDFRRHEPYLYDDLNYPSHDDYQRDRYNWERNNYDRNNSSYSRDAFQRPNRYNGPNHHPEHRRNYGNYNSNFRNRRGWVEPDRDLDRKGGMYRRSVSPDRFHERRRSSSFERFNDRRFEGDHSKRYSSVDSNSFSSDSSLGSSRSRRQKNSRSTSASSSGPSRGRSRTRKGDNRINDTKNASKNSSSSRSTPERSANLKKLKKSPSLSPAKDKGKLPLINSPEFNKVENTDTAVKDGNINTSSNNTQSQHPPNDSKIANYHGPKTINQEDCNSSIDIVRASSPLLKITVSPNKIGAILSISENSLPIKEIIPLEKNSKPADIFGESDISSEYGGDFSSDDDGEKKNRGSKTHTARSGSDEDCPSQKSAGSGQENSSDSDTEIAKDKLKKSLKTGSNLDSSKKRRGPGRPPGSKNKHTDDFLDLQQKKLKEYAKKTKSSSGQKILTKKIIRKVKSGDEYTRDETSPFKDRHLRKSPSLDVGKEEGVILLGRKRPLPFSMINDKDRSGRHRLFKHAANNDLESVKALINAGINIHQRDNADCTALHESCLNGHLEIVKCLVQAGADVNSVGDNKDTPLHDACANHHFEVVQFLLENGASTSLRNDDQETPYDVATDKRIIMYLKKWQESLKKVLTKDMNGLTPLHHACANGELGKVKEYINMGANVNGQDNAGWTPLHEASLNGHHEVVEYLLLHGASVDAAGLDGDTALMDAVTNCEYKTVEVLLEFGANVLLKNNAGNDSIQASLNSNNGSSKLRTKIMDLLKRDKSTWLPYRTAEFNPSVIPNEKSTTVDTESLMSRNSSVEIDREKKKKVFRADSVDSEENPRDLTTKGLATWWGASDTTKMSLREERKIQALIRNLEQSEGVSGSSERKRKDKFTDRKKDNSNEDLKYSDNDLTNEGKKKRGPGRPPRRRTDSLDEDDEIGFQKGRDSSPDRKRVKIEDEPALDSSSNIEIKKEHKEKEKITKKKLDVLENSEPNTSKKEGEHKVSSSLAVTIKSPQRKKRKISNLTGYANVNDSNISEKQSVETVKIEKSVVKTEKSEDVNTEKKGGSSSLKPSEKIDFNKVKALNVKNIVVGERKDTSSPSTSKPNIPAIETPSAPVPASVLKKKIKKKKDWTAPVDVKDGQELTASLLGRRDSVPDSLHVSSPTEIKSLESKLLETEEMKLLMLKRLKDVAIYAVSLPDNENVKKTSRYITDMQISLLWGYRKCPDFLEKHPNLIKKVAITSEKQRLERSPLSESVYNLMLLIGINPQYLRTSTNNEGKKGLVLSNYDIHFLKEEEVFKEIEVVYETYKNKLEGELKSFKDFLKIIPLNLENFGDLSDNAVPSTLNNSTVNSVLSKGNSNSSLISISSTVVTEAKSTETVTNIDSSASDGYIHKRFRKNLPPKKKFCQSTTEN
ncbi:hypothetical protein HK099_005802 [Clydaea vesicula]|uniref:Uncharacterized protein n=1 Tax=Clydaea vesicula TaxID=447962 RepID=A0AAD5Y364_9FUNG|nr:hypothetical protein HK099_005802 [Clydaea vesicula]